MSQVEVRRRLSTHEVEAVRVLVAAAGARADLPIDLGRVEQMAAGGHADRPVCAALAWPAGRPHPDAYAQAVRTGRRWDLDLVVDPSRAHDRATLGPAVLAPVLGAVAGTGGGPANLWQTEPDATLDHLTGALGLHPDRDLWQMRRPLPMDEPAGIATRPFVVGRDEPAWIAVNNRAFAGHAEQGGWTVDDLRAEERAPWFDPVGFRLHERDGQLAGFCWTKVHADHDPPLGEIYVIAADPAHHGTGLGRALTLAGLDHLTRSGLATAMLYVAADNESAVALYRRLGFTVHHVDRAYSGHVAPGGR